MLLTVKSSVFIIYIISYLNSNAYATVESKISKEEAAAIQKLRIRVEKYLTQDYMKDDHYLLRFLRFQKLNVDAAYEQIIRGLKWRKDNKIDGILDDKYESERFFPYDLLEARDGRPVAAGKLSDFKLRRYLIAGKGHDLIRTAYKMLEFALFKFREASANTGANITSGIVIGDVSGLNFREHVCALCLQLFFQMLPEYEKYYPGTAHKLIAVNTPRLGASLFDTYKHLASEHLRETVAIYGYDKNQWIPELLKVVSKEQLPVYLGGTNAGPRYLGNHRIEK